METRPRVTGPKHPLVAAYHRARADRDRIFTRHRPMATAILSHHHAQARSDESVYRITCLRADGPNPWDEVLSWDYVGPIEDHADLAGQQGYITVRTHNPRVVQALYPAADDHEVYLTLIKAASKAAPQITLMLAIGAASGAIEWDTGETIREAALRIAMDAALTIKDESSWNHTPDRVLDTVRGAYGQTRPMRDYANDYLTHRENILADLERAEIPLGDPLLEMQEVVNLVGIERSTLRAYVSRGEAPAPDADRGTRNPKWREITVTAWLLRR